MNNKYWRIILLLAGLCIHIFSAQAENTLIFITHPPGAGVFLEGVKLGNTPLTLDSTGEPKNYFKNPGKKYDFIIYKEFFEGEIITLTYKQGQQDKIEMNLYPLTRLPLYNGRFQAGYRLDFYTLLMNSDPEELELMKCEIHAKHGKRIEIKGKNPFANEPWYKVNPYYSADFLDETDMANLELLNIFSHKNAEDVMKKNSILEIEKFKSVENDLQLFFVDESTVELSTDRSFLLPEGNGKAETLDWNIINDTVYIWNTKMMALFEIILNLEAATIDMLRPITYIPEESE